MSPAEQQRSIERTPTDAALKTRVVLLGTGTPNADPDRSGPAVAVVVGGRSYLVDCGPGVVRRAAAAYHNGIESLRADRLTRLFITHLHSDHTIGLPDLILTPWALDRKQPLQVYGPPGTEQMTDHLLKAYAEDIAVRLHGNQPIDPQAQIVKAKDVTPGRVYRDQQVEVTAFAVRHGAWKHAYGFKFVTADRTVVISGDTTPADSVVEQCNGCDVLVHEVYSKAAFDRREPSWQAYHAASHTSTEQLAEIARRAKPGLLVLYHQLLWGATPQQCLDEIRRGYSGKVVYGNDLDVY